MKMTISRILILGIIIASIQSLALYAQSFDDEWNVINKELDSGKVLTAEPLIKELFTKAKKNTHSPTMLKCILHLSVLTGKSGEPDDRNIVLSIKQYADSLDKDEEIAILHIYLAQALKNYLHYHRSEIDQRSYEEYSIDDYATLQNWTKSQFMKAISSEIDKALRNPGLLLSIPARSYSDLLRVKFASDIYRPTLFDIISHAAIGLYESLEQDINREYRPICTDPRIFSLAKDFMELNSKDLKGFDLEYGTFMQRMELYQTILRNHVSDQNPTAFTDADIHRVIAMSSGSEHPFKDSLLLSALLRIGNESPGNLATPNALYEAAVHYSNTEQNKKAIVICNEVFKKYPGSFAAEQCKAMVDRLNNKALDFTLQKQIMPNKPFLFRTEYSNVDRIFCRIYALTEDIERRVKKSRYRDLFWDESAIEELMNMQPVQAWKQELPKTDDYREHSTLKKGPPLKNGKYVMLMSNAPVFKKKEDNVIVYSEFQVSSITATMQKEIGGGIYVHVMESEQGSPLKATVQIMESVYDQEKNSYSDVITETFQTNELGSIFIPPLKQDVYVRDRSLRIISQSDTLIIDNSVNRFQNRDEDIKERVKLFTDRSMYRPGQQIQFKGIVFSQDPDDKAKVLSDKKLLIRFRDARGKTLDSMNCLSNEFGSITGTFRIPNDIVTGFCSLQSDIGTASIKVEEYKKPTFEITFKGTNNPLLGDNIVMNGSVNSFAGAVHSGAQVRYTILRSNSFHPFDYSFMYRIPYSPDREIARGQTIVDQSGNFTIQFIAEPDPTISSTNPSLYNYSIKVDVIASNGELQRADTIISVGVLKAMYNFKHQTISPNSVKPDITLQCTLQNGQPAKGMKGTIIVETLKKHPLKLALPFELGDMEGITQKDKDMLFPFDQCDTALYHKAEAIIYSEVHSSDENGMINPKLPILKPGRYRIRFTTDNETIPYSIESTWSVIDETSTQMPLDEHLMLHARNRTASVGDTIKYMIGSAWRNASILHQIEYKGSIISQKRIQLSESMSMYELPILPTYRGGVAIHCTMVKHGRIITQTLFIDVPWKDKVIEIKPTVLRNKTQPGAKEEWTFSLHYPKSNTPIEVMGIVYDASLDPLFQKEPLMIHNLWITHYALAQPTGLTFGTSFGSSIFGDEWNEAAKQIGLREFDELNMDLLLGGIFGRTEMIYMSDMVQERKVTLQSYRSMSDEMIVPRNVPLSMNESSTTKQQFSPRHAFQETAFFSPALPLNNNLASMKFTMPDALTRWNIQLFAHAKDMSYGSIDTFVISQKPFMVSTHVPRFLRVGDNIEIKSMIHALEGDQSIPVEAYLQYYVDDDSMNVQEIKTQASVSESAPGLASWTLQIPNAKKIHLLIGAKSDDLNDAESYTLPILPSKNLITDRYPIWLDGKVRQSKEFILDQAKDIESFSYTLATEPFWFAAESLPDLLNPGFGSILDQAQRLLSAQLAQTYMLNNPIIRSALKDSTFNGRILQNSKQFSDLEIGPWESDMIQQEMQSKNIQVYANEQHMNMVFESALQSLQTMQTSEGGFSWFPTMPASTFITSQVLTLLGICDGLQKSDSKNRDMAYMIGRTIRWLDDQQSRELKRLLDIQSNKDTLRLTLSDIQYFYARSFFIKQYPLPQEHWVEPLMNELWSQRMKFGFQAEAMITLFFQRMGDVQKSTAMLRSLKERSIQDEQGIHWTMRSTSWHDADIETHAMLFSAFQEINSESDIADGIITYMLRQKQTRNWSTRSATLSAVMSILNMSKQCIGNAENVTVKINDQAIKSHQSSSPGIKTHTVEQPANVKKMEVLLSGSCPIWGGAFRNRLVDLSDTFSSNEEEFQVQRAFYRKTVKPEQRIIPIKEGESIELGETLLMRININSPLTMNYVHVQDLFPSCFDLMANNSEYRHFQNLSAYVIPRDIGMNFFIDYLPKGHSMLEYEVKVDKAGIFSKGMVKAYSIFAPEFGIAKGGGKVIITP
ncbi:MAG: alpha-2-macroglobulin family protein [Candidatus Kapaibacteriota bacterium]